MYGKILTAGAVLALGMNTAFAAVTADYTAAPSSTGDEGVIGPFDTFDAAQGVALVAVGGGAPTVGDLVDVVYQAHLQGHQLGGVSIVDPLLNVNYEVTLVAQFREIVTGVVGTTVTTEIVPGVGGAWIYVDTTPDYSYTGDSGFTDGDLIVTGVILEGFGSLTNLGFGAVGFEALTNIQILSQDTNVFDPDLLSANGIFTLSTFGTSILGVGSVLGNAVGSNLLIAADGNISVSAVPVPAAVWLLGSALAGFATVRRRA